MDMDSFFHPLVRDLAWLIGGPSLMAAGTPGLDVPPTERMQQLIEEAQPWLTTLERQPADVERWMARHHSPRLGHHAEALMEFWLRQAPGIRFVAGRHIITDGVRTLGDLDLLFDDDVRGVRVHWEMAVKFYVQALPAPEWSQWIGPDARDRLDLKVRRIIDQQLPLGRHPNANLPLTNNDTNLPVQSEAYLRGWLFTATGTEDAGPIGSAPGHGQGWWLRHGEGEVRSTSRASRFVVLPRLAWMPPARLAPGGTPAISGGELAQYLDHHFRTLAKAVLIAEVQRDAAGWWAEISRGFVLHPQWPVQPQDTKSFK